MGTWAGDQLTFAPPLSFFAATKTRLSEDRRVGLQHRDTPAGTDGWTHPGARTSTPLHRQTGEDESGTSWKKGEERGVRVWQLQPLRDFTAPCRLRQLLRLRECTRVRVRLRVLTTGRVCG